MYLVQSIEQRLQISLARGVHAMWTADVHVEHCTCYSYCMHSARTVHDEHMHMEWMRGAC